MSLGIIGAGLGRTGTASLKIALDQLGIGPCYHMSEVFKNPEHIGLWERVADGEPDWDAIFGAYGATVDYPSSTYWRELSERYPDAKVILTVRDAEKWFESTQETILSPRVVEFTRPTPFGAMMKKTIWDTMDERMHDRAFMIDHFNRHVEEVKRTVPAERLLVYEVKQGWEPLCEFLGVAVPGDAFPRVNSREETASMLDALIATGESGMTDEVMAQAAERVHKTKE